MADFDIEVHPIYGLTGATGATGATGNGISSITKTATSGLQDIYTITYTNGTTTSLNVTNGNGINSIEKTSTDGLVDTYTITFDNGNETTYTVTNGAKGDTGDKGDIGNGITDISKTSTSGLIDTYTITYDDETTTNFTVTNGAKGDTGLTPDITMSASVDSNVGTPSVNVSKSGTDENPVFNLSFSNLKGIQGEQGVSVTGVTLQSTVGLDKTYRMTFSDNTYFDYVVSNGAAGSTEWGGISGVLSNQTDLQSALNGKYDSSNPNGYTSNIGTITGITMNGTSKGTSGVVDLGTVITSHQDISGKEDKNKSVNTLSTSGTITLTDNSINKITPSGNVTFSLPTVSDTAVFHQILVQINLTTVCTINLGTTYFFNKEAPDMSEVGKYNLIFEYSSDLNGWVAGVLSKGAAS